MFERPVDPVPPGGETRRTSVFPTSLLLMQCDFLIKDAPAVDSKVGRDALRILVESDLCKTAEFMTRDWTVIRATFPETVTPHDVTQALLLKAGLSSTPAETGPVLAGAGGKNRIGFKEPLVVNIHTPEDSMSQSSLVEIDLDHPIEGEVGCSGPRQGLPADMSSGDEAVKIPAGVPAEEGSKRVVRLEVLGMTCASCVNTIKGELMSFPEVIRCEIALLSQRAVVEYISGGGSEITGEKIAGAVNSLGFEASVLPEWDTGVSEFLVPEISSSPSAAKVIEDVLLPMTGITEVISDPMSQKVSVRYESGKVGVRDIAEKIWSLGYSASLDEEPMFDAHYDTLNREKELNLWSNLSRISMRYAIPVLILTMVLPHLGRGFPNNVLSFEPLSGIPLLNIILLVLCVQMHTTAGKIFYQRAYAASLHGVYTMDALIILGASSSLIFSILSILVSLFTKKEGEVFFETSAMLIAFVSVGRYIENISKKRASKELTELMILFPTEAVLLEPKVASKAFVIPPKIVDKFPGLHIDKQDSNILSEVVERFNGEFFPLHLYNEKKIQLKYIQTGDMLKVVPGGRIPTDSIVISGESFVDESAVTGEHLPVHKVVGDTTIGGTINGPTSIVVVATRVGRETTIAQMIKLVSDAQISKASIQGLADVVSGVFVPTVISLGVITFVAWMIIGYGFHWSPPSISRNTSYIYAALNMAISVVVIACPCALGLATPTAIMVGTGVAARHGIVIKGAPSLEKVGKVTKIVFDKTGTLTTGKLSMVHKKFFPSICGLDHEVGRCIHPLFLTENGFWNAVIAAENFSEHFIGNAIVSGLKCHRFINIGEERQKEENEMGFIGPSCLVTDYKSVVGSGISCKVLPPREMLEKYPHNQEGGEQDYSVELLAGNKSFLASNNCIEPPEYAVKFTELEQRCNLGGYTAIYVAINRRVMGLVALCDSPKPEAAATVRFLEERGVRTCMITGDQEASAVAVAKEVGISEVYFGATPAGKQALINRFKSEGHVVAMVGDGINDSASLASADLGVVVSTASSVSIEASDMVLVRNDLTGVVVAIDLSGKIMRRIKINFAWAFCYNIFMIPLAMGILAPFGITLPAMAAGFAMSLSSVSVVVSSLLLNMYSPPRASTSTQEIDPTSPHSPDALRPQDVEECVEDNIWGGSSRIKIGRTRARKVWRDQVLGALKKLFVYRGTPETNTKRGDPISMAEDFIFYYVPQKALKEYHNMHGYTNT